MNLRIKNLQKNIVSEKLDGFISFNPSNIFYLTGFPAGNSFVFVSRKDAVLLVSELDYPSAKRYANCAVRILKGDFFESYKNKRLGIDDTVPAGRFEKLRKNKGVRFKYCSNFVENIRIIKEKSEILNIKTACLISKKAIAFASKKLKAGITEKELADDLEYFIRRTGAEKSAFDTIVASGKNAADPHHKPGGKKIRSGETVVIDLGCFFGNYCSDLTRTYFLGKINRYAEKAFEVVKAAQKKAVGIIRDGVSCKEVDGAARDLIEKNGFGKYFIHSTGHGVGIDIHEEPFVSQKSETILRAGMVVTVEPGIYVPGKFGIRIEDTVLVAKRGCEVLTI